MNWFKVTIRLKSPTGTPWQADTIFGHLCWVLAHRDGEAALKRFLQPFLGGEPAFLLSDGSPSGFLPRPLTFKLPGDDTPETFRKNRSLRKQLYLSKDEFYGALRGDTSVITLTEAQREKQAEELKKSLYTRAVLKNQISRVTGTTGEEGNLFGFIEHWMPEVVIYGRVRADYEDFLKELWQDFKLFGYGKRKGVGYGAIDALDFSSFDGFPAPDGANGFVTLSAFVPSPGDPTEGRWRLRVKYGRLGEEFAFSSTPFKKPVVMLEPGSVFYDMPVKAHYGRMVADVSAIQGVVHYGYALPLPMSLPKQGNA